MVTKVRKIRLKSLVDIRRFIASVINDIRQGRMDHAEGKTYGYLASILQSIVKDSELEQRIEALEKAQTAEATR